MESAPLVDCAGRRRSPATLPGYHRGRPPRNKGLRYPPDPPTVEGIIAAMRAAGDDPDGVRLRGLIVVLWRAGLRISEALALAESDLDRVRGAIQVRHGKGGRRREVGMDRWAWDALDPWIDLRAGLPIGALFCVLRGPTRGRPCSAAGVRVQLRNADHSRGASPAGATSAPACPRGRDVARGRTARGHTAATCRPRGHVRVLARHRQHRDRARRPRTPRADDPRGQRASAHALSRPSAVSLGAAHRPVAAGCPPRTCPHRPAPPRALRS
jgi:integrase